MICMLFMIIWSNCFTWDIYLTKVIITPTIHHFLNIRTNTPIVSIMTRCTFNIIYTSTTFTFTLIIPTIVILRVPFLKYDCTGMPCACFDRTVSNKVVAAWTGFTLVEVIVTPTVQLVVLVDRTHVPCPQGVLHDVLRDCLIRRIDFTLVVTPAPQEGWGTRVPGVSCVRSRREDACRVIVGLQFGFRSGLSLGSN